MSKPIAPIPNVSLPPPGGLYGRRATWVATQENNNDNKKPIQAPSPLPPPPPSSSQLPSLFNDLDQGEIDPATALEIRRASIATLPQARWRTSTPTPTSSSSSIPLVGPQALVAELAKFDNGTPYEELRYVMELTAAQASQGIYPISSQASSSSRSSSVYSSSPPGGRAYSPTGESSFYAESDSTLPQARDAMDPILSPAARRYLDEYNLGQHRLPVSPPSSHSHSFFNPPPPQFPYYPAPPTTSPSITGGITSPFVVETTPLSTFPFGPIQPSGSYFPGPAITPIPPNLLPSPPPPPPAPGVAPVPTFDFQLDSSPSIGGNQFLSSTTTGSLSPSFTSSTNSSFTSTPPTGFVFTPSTTPSNSPNPESETPLDPKSVTEQFLALRRQKKKSLVRLCAEEHARTKGAVKSWGIVKFFDGNKGWGFILDQSRVPGEDVWTHYTNLEIPRGHRFLVSEEVVEYLIVWDSKKSQLKALLVTGLGGTPLLAFSDPTLAASLTKFKPSQGPLPPTLSPNTKKQIYAAKREKQRRLDEEVKKERMKRFLERELVRNGGGGGGGGGGINKKKNEEEDEEYEEEEEEEEE
ncbi:hypothetical protein JCM5350_007551, partial [Sporobolomyces pararoseus]